MGKQEDIRVRTGMIYIKNGCLSFGHQTVFDSITLSFQQDQKIGVYGRNGAGKSTLLKVLAGKASFDEGLVELERHKKIGYMPQEVALLSEKTVYEETLSVFEKYLILEEEKQKLELQLAQEAAHEKLLERYTAVLEESSAYDLSHAKERTERILKGLGFSKKMFEQNVQELSVGWKMRIVLAKLLLEDADFYLFDEPTNHLDLPTKEWFLEFLQEGRFGFLLVSHDRHYLDEGCDSILSLERGKAKLFRGNFSAFIKEEEHQRELTHAAYVQQQKDISRKQKTIDRFRASASKSRMALSMEKQLDKVERIEIEPIIPTLKVTFPSLERPGAQVLTLENIRHAFEGVLLFQQVTGMVQRGERVALVAPNGTGKTTLFNVICGKYERQAGSVVFGHKVQCAIFEQDQLRSLNQRNTVIEELLEGVPALSEAIIRSFLGAFLFSGEAIYKKISVLSGGERNRVAMVKVLLQKANFLLLDEPTNHLDLHAKEVLLQALQRYEGTILFVSHDHSFLQSLATRIWELTPTGLHDFGGTYEEFLYYKKQQDSEQTKKGPVAPSKKAVESTKTDENTTALKREIHALEQKINKVERELATIHKEFEVLVYGSTDYEKAAQRYTTLKKSVDELTHTWEQAQRALSNS